MTLDKVEMIYGVQLHENICTFDNFSVLFCRRKCLEVNILASWKEM